ENVETFFGGPHPRWELSVGDFQDLAPTLSPDEPSVDRVVLDMLAPWECVDAAAGVLVSGGVFLAYVATVTQLSRTAEALRDHGEFTEPYAWESFVRPWHLEGLAVRPEHRMNAHTGFLLTSRRTAHGTAALRPAARAAAERARRVPAPRPPLRARRRGAAPRRTAGARVAPRGGAEPPRQRRLRRLRGRVDCEGRGGAGSRPAQAQAGAARHPSGPRSVIATGKERARP